LDEQVRYWKRQLEGAPGVVEVASDRSRPAVASYRGATQEVEVGVEVREGLKEMSRGEGATLYMALMSAYRVLLWRYSGQGDVVIGTPIANRSRAEVEGLIGFFVNTLVMRSRVGGGMSYREVMRREKEVALGAYGHQEVPFEKLVEELRPERNLSYTPLFQVVFALQNTSAEELKLRGMRLRAKAVSNGTTNFDLILNVKETEEGLRGVMEYSTDLFDASTIRRMLESFKALLEGVVANPDARLVDIPITSESREAAAGYGSSPQSVFEGDRFVF
jgi:non-ribosomal peptide synthetase component F